MIPSDTDFRIFRDYGHIPGLDIAFVADGYVYHTEYDTSHRIPLGSIQRAGDNVLAVVSRLARFKHLAAVQNMTDTATSAVYFDLLGVRMISYPAWLGVIITGVMFIINGFIINSDIERNTKKLDLSYSDAVRIILTMILGVVLTLLLALSLTGLLSLLLGWLGASMSWYSRPSLLFFLYSLPAVYSVLVVTDTVRTAITNKFALSQGSVSLQMFSFHAVNSILIIIGSFLTLLGVKSAFMLSHSLMFPVGWWLLTRLTGRSQSGWSSFLLLNLVMVVPLSLWSYIMQLVFTIFIPIMGRRGQSVNPDLILGLVTALFTVILAVLVLPVFYSLRQQRLVRGVLLLVHLVTVLLVTTTSLGFPYSGSVDWPTPKRLTAYHVSRFTEDGERSGGGLVCSEDYHSLSASQYPGAADISKLCGDRLNCGLPTTSIRRLSTEGCVWLPAQPPSQHTDTNIQVVGLEHISPDLTNITIRVAGPSRLMLHISTRGNVSLGKARKGSLLYFCRKKSGFVQNHSGLRTPKVTSSLDESRLFPTKIQ